ALASPLPASWPILPPSAREGRSPASQTPNQLWHIPCRGESVHVLSFEVPEKEFKAGFGPEVASW
uniref:Uncharacterized protein n=1 Tax=Varanus komodoensis TaxID=61221 RepID=A0A8D2LCQ4_VARKO